MNIDDFLNESASNREYLEITPPTEDWRRVLEIAGWVVVPILQAGRSAYALFQKAGLPNVIGVPPSLTDKLTFPLGSPTDRVLFRRHPYDDRRYVPIAEFNPYLLKDKIAELARVLTAAGATSFDIVADSAETAELVVEASASVGDSVTGDFKAKRSAATKIQWTYEGSGEGAGSLPDDIYWFNHQPEWQTIWDSAVRRGGRAHSLKINQDASMEVSSSLAAKFKNAGFKLGGEFRSVSSSDLTIKVAFAAR